MLGFLLLEMFAEMVRILFEQPVKYGFSKMACNQPFHYCSYDHSDIHTALDTVVHNANLRLIVRIPVYLELFDAIHVEQQLSSTTATTSPIDG